jgi:hypothetical protein
VQPEDRITAVAPLRDPVLLLAAWRQPVEPILRRLKASGIDIARGRAIDRGPAAPASADPVTVRRWMAAVASAADDFVALARAEPSAAEWIHEVEAVRARGDATSRSMLAVSGDDLVAAGIVAPGPALGKLLAVCGATAAGSATCVATGVVDPGAVGIGGGDGERAALERPVADAPTGPAAGDAIPINREESVPTDNPTPAQQAQKEFGVESASTYVVSDEIFGNVPPIATSRSGCGYGNGLNTKPSRSPKISVLPPIPSAREINATAVNPGRRVNCRTA